MAKKAGKNTANDLTTGRLIELIKDYPKFIREGAPDLIPTENKENLTFKSHKEFYNFLYKDMPDETRN